MLILMVFYQYANVVRENEDISKWLVCFFLLLDMYLYLFP